MSNILNINRDFYIRLLILLAIPSYIICGRMHVCMAGHMQHPPFSVFDWLNDVFWISLMVLATVFLMKSTVKGKGLLMGALVFLIASRLLFGSFGGLLFLIEFPLAFLVGAISLGGIIKSKSKKWSWLIYAIGGLLIIITVLVILLWL